MNIQENSSALRSLLVNALIGGAAVVAFTGLAVAGPDDVPRVVVKYGDLDTQNGKGAEELYRRIKAAADKVCSHVEADRFFAYYAKKACVDDAIDRAVAQVGNPLVTALDRSKRGTTKSVRLSSVSTNQ